MTSQEELREKIIEIRRRLEGRKNTHVQVSKHSGWTNLELSNVLEEDEWLYEKEMLALIEAHTAKAVEEARMIGEQNQILDLHKWLLEHENKTINRSDLFKYVDSHLERNTKLSTPKSNGNLVKGMK